MITIPLGVSEIHSFAYIFLKNLLSDAVHFHCLGTHTQVASFDMYLIPEKSGWEGWGAGFLSPISSQTARNFKKIKIQYESR